MAGLRLSGCQESYAHNWQVDIDMLTDSLGKDAFEWRRELRWILNVFSR